MLERTKLAELESAGVSPTRTLLFVGAPGVGKTLAARWLARELQRPLITLDLATVIKVSQAISGEIVLDKLINTLMRIALEQAGAERGLLILGCGETTIRLCPPLIVNEQEANIALDILEECIQLAAK